MLAIIVVSVLQLIKLEHKEGKWLSQGYTVQAGARIWGRQTATIFHALSYTVILFSLFADKNIWKN